MARWQLGWARGAQLNRGDVSSERYVIENASTLLARPKIKTFSFRFKSTSRRVQRSRQQKVWRPAITIAKGSFVPSFQLLNKIQNDDPYLQQLKREVHPYHEHSYHHVRKLRSSSLMPEYKISSVAHPHKHTNDHTTKTPVTRSPVTSQFPWSCPHKKKYWQPVNGMLQLQKSWFTRGGLR